MRPVMDRDDSLSVRLTAAKTNSAMRTSSLPNISTSYADLQRTQRMGRPNIIVTIIRDIIIIVIKCSY